METEKKIEIIAEALLEKERQGELCPETREVLEEIAE